MLERISRIILLKDFYGPLLTDKQQNILSLHFENDLSYSEIGDEYNISRQAVYDLVRRAENVLEQYEEKLGLVNKFQDTNQRLSEIQNLLKGGETDGDRIQQAIDLLQEINSLL
ncbi:MAG: YlxM family DNA-binding protein [Bacillota bacterium]|nr:YlxM family DNA-binding protein [Bacillota bacterium]